MIVSLDAQGQLALEDALNCHAFSFRSDGSEMASNEHVLFSDGMAWVSEKALRAWPPLRENDEWQANLTGMIAYAASKGWVDKASGRIRAHVEGL